MWLEVSSGVWGSGKRNGEIARGLGVEWMVGMEERGKNVMMWIWRRRRRRREKAGDGGSVEPGDEGVEWEGMID